MYCHLKRVPSVNNLGHVNTSFYRTSVANSRSSIKGSLIKKKKEKERKANRKGGLIKWREKQNKTIKKGCTVKFSWTRIKIYMRVLVNSHVLQLYFIGLNSTLLSLHKATKFSTILNQWGETHTPTRNSGLPANWSQGKSEGLDALLNGTSAKAPGLGWNQQPFGFDASYP